MTENAHQVTCSPDSRWPASYTSRRSRRSCAARFRGLLVFNRRGVRHFRRQGHLLNEKAQSKASFDQWFGRQDIYGFIYRSWMKNRGVPHDMFDGRPVIGICNTWSELTPCTTHFASSPTTCATASSTAGAFRSSSRSCRSAKTLMRPTAMLYRNLASMDVEDRSAPIRSTAWSFSPAATRLRPLRSWVRAASTSPPSSSPAGRCSPASTRQRHRLGDQHLVDVGGSACRQDHARGVPRGRVLHAPVHGPLHDDGHRVDDGVG